MKRATWSLAAASVLLGHAWPAAGQPQSSGVRPGATQLLQVPVSGNPIGGQPPPDIRNPYAGSANAIVQGEKLFNAMNCSGCHAPLGGGGMGPPLSDREWIYGSEPANVYLSIAQGRPNGMPAWGRSLPPESIWNLVAYIETLGHASASDAPREPAPPSRPAPNPLGLP